MRRLAAAVVLLTAVATLVGCGGDDESPSLGATSPADSSPTRSPDPVQVRVVRGSPQSPAPACAKRNGQAPPECDLASLDCADPVRIAPGEAMGACAAGDPQARYLLEPAEAVGGVESAVAAEVDGRWQVQVTFGGRSLEEISLLSTSLIGTTEQVAFVVGGQVVSTAAFVEPITDGRLTISGDFTREQAEELAAALLAGG